MFFRRLSLYKVVALSMLGMSLVALALVFISARIHRDVSYDTSRSITWSRASAGW